MVTFRLKEESDRQLVYWYFPHGKEENGHGTIVIDRALGKLDVTELAPDDRLVRHTVENQNRWRNAVNQMRNIEQIPELTDEEWPEATEDKISTVFADHAIQKIVEAYNNGEVLEEGVETWNI